MYGSASHEKKKFDIYRTIKTLDELTTQINKNGFTIKRSRIYLRLMPKRSNSLQGQRHVQKSLCAIPTFDVNQIIAPKHHHMRFCFRKYAILTKVHFAFRSWNLLVVQMAF